MHAEVEKFFRQSPGPQGGMEEGPLCAGNAITAGLSAKTAARKSGILKFFFSPRLVNHSTEETAAEGHGQRAQNPCRANIM